MIYLTTTTIIPKVTSGEPSSIKFVNQTTKEETAFSTIADSGNFYTLSIEELPSNGQYDYYIYDKEDSLLASGIAQVGDYSRTNTKYSTDINIKTYR